MIPDDEFLERIVAGVHAVADSEADVAWNQHINGRQFDVVVRFKRGPLSYFVLVEVKNKKRKATAEDLDAFVTKARDQNANKAVFVTAAGFQSGALKVAQRHGIDLFTLTFLEDEFDLPENLHFQLNDEAENPTEIPYIKHTGREIINVFEQICLVYKGGARFELPDEPSQMDYYLRTTLLKGGSSLYDILRKENRPRPGLNESEALQIKLSRPQLIQPRDEYFFPKGKIIALDCTVTGKMAYMITGNVKIPTTLFRSPVLYTNAITGESYRYRLDELPLGGADPVELEFYAVHHPLRYYQCAKINGDEVTWHLIETFQNSQLLTGTFRQDIQYAKYYIPVRDLRTRRRLKLRLRDYLRRSGQL